MPHEGDWRAAQTPAKAALFNRPPLWARGPVPALLETALVSATPACVVIDTIKPAEDGNGWVVRLYESFGGRVRARLRLAPPVATAFLSNTLEDRIEELQLEEGGLTLELRGFQIVTLRLM